MPEHGRKGTNDLLILNEDDDKMNIKIILFGQLCDIAGSDSLVMEDITDTNGLEEQLKKQYPGLAASKYIIAVDKKIVQGNISLNENKTVALLPPFSGG
jgi:sulfur-carrier protein